MSEDKDRDYQPKPHSFKRFQTTVADRPKRVTRKALDYKESPIVVESDEGEETTEGTSEGAVERVLVNRRGTKGLWDEPSERDCNDTASDLTVKSDCWSPQTVEHRTGVLFEGLQEVKSQLRQRRMAEREELGVNDLIKLMMEMNSKQEVEREKRDKRLAEESRVRMEKMAEDARIREEEREERALVREQKRVEEAKLREEERKVQAEERELKMVVALKETRPVIESAKLPTMEKGTDIESFLELFETALTVAKIPEDKWLPRLHTALDSETKLLVRDVFTNPDASFDDAKKHTCPSQLLQRP